MQVQYFVTCGLSPAQFLWSAPVPTARYQFQLFRGIVPILIYFSRKESKSKWGEKDFSEMGSACILWLDWQTIFKYFNPNCEVILHVILIVGGLLYLHWPTKPLWYFFIFSKFYALGKVKVKTCRPFFMEQDQKSTWCDNI